MRWQPSSLASSLPRLPYASCINCIEKLLSLPHFLYLEISLVSLALHLPILYRQDAIADVQQGRNDPIAAGSSVTSFCRCRDSFLLLQVYGHCVYFALDASFAVYFLLLDVHRSRYFALLLLHIHCHPFPSLMSFASQDRTSMSIVDSR